MQVATSRPVLLAVTMTHCETQAEKDHDALLLLYRCCSSLKEHTELQNDLNVCVLEKILDYN